MRRLAAAGTALLLAIGLGTGAARLPGPGEVGLSAPPGASVPGEGTESIEAVLDFDRNTPPSAEGEFHVTVTAEYLPDSGAFAIHRSDFLMYGVDAGVDPRQSGPDSPGYVEYPLTAADELALLTPDDPVAEFDLRAEIPGPAYLHYLPRPGTAWGPGHGGTPAWGTHLCAGPGGEGEPSAAVFTGLGAYC